MEDLTLTTPTSVSTYRVQRVFFDWEHAKIRIEVAAPGLPALAKTYSGATATTLMTQLNKLNLSVQSLHKRILDRLVTDGVLPAGTVTGTPD